MTDVPESAGPSLIDKAHLSGLILPARVRQSWLDHCDLDLLDPQGRVLAKGRLYQTESLCANDPRLLRDIDAYGKGQVLAAVYVNNQRQQDGEPLWYVHERWGRCNPWPDLTLDGDSVVSGTVVRRVGSAERPEPAGYIIQLDTEDTLHRAVRVGTEPAEVQQPDIEAFLPINEIPWADGGLISQSKRPDARRLGIEIGDRIRALVLEVQQPPKNPRVSLVRLINHQDATSDRAFEHREGLARWRFRRLLGGVTASLVPDAAVHLFSADERPYAGRRLLLVDDDEPASASQTELLGLMGAEVHRILVHGGGFGQAVAEVMAALAAAPFDLVLVDNNLPGRGLGRLLIRQVCERLDGTGAARLILLSANAAKGGGDLDVPTLKVEGITGLVHRPMSHRTLQRLLAGEEVWDLTEPFVHTAASQSRDAIPAITTPDQVLAAIAAQPGVQFAVLLRARHRLASSDLTGFGKLPFTQRNFDEVLEQTGLGLLLSGRISALPIGSDDPGNGLLRIARNDAGHWQVLQLGKARWVFGVGLTKGVAFEHCLPLWHCALTAALEAQDWRDAARHSSAFIQLGLAHQGLTHEIFNLQDEFGSRLGILRRHLDRLRPEGKLSAEERQRVDDALRKLIIVKEQILEFAKGQLRAEAFRHREVFLPEAISTVRRIVEVQCQEAQVALHIAPPPPLALPLPNAALVLPLVNLIVNAAKHQRRRENRRIELLFDVAEEDDGQWLIADVRDNGFGLDQTTLERLFEPGYSSADALDQRHGIGLWLSYQLVSEAGGTLRLAENWRGVGACFQMRLPINLG